MSRLKRVRSVTTMRSSLGFFYSDHSTVGYRLSIQPDEIPVVEELAYYFPELQKMLDEGASSILFTPSQRKQAQTIQDIIIRRANQHRTASQREDYALSSVRSFLNDLRYTSNIHSHAG